MSQVECKCGRGRGKGYYERRLIATGGASANIAVPANGAREYLHVSMLALPTAAADDTVGVRQAIDGNSVLVRGLCRGDMNATLSYATDGDTIFGPFTVTSGADVAAVAVYEVQWRPENF